MPPSAIAECSRMWPSVSDNRSINAGTASAGRPHFTQQHHGAHPAVPRHNWPVKPSLHPRRQFRPQPDPRRMQPGIWSSQCRDQVRRHVGPVGSEEFRVIVISIRPQRLLHPHRNQFALHHPVRQSLAPADAWINEQKHSGGSQCRQKYFPLSFHSHPSNAALSQRQVCRPRFPNVPAAYSPTCFLMASQIFFECSSSTALSLPSISSRAFGSVPE